MFQLPADRKYGFLERKRKKQASKKKLLFSPNSFVFHHNTSKRLNILLFRFTTSSPFSLHFDFLPLTELASMLTVTPQNKVTSPFCAA